MKNKELVDYLISNKGTTPQQAAEHFDVSVRTMRKYVSKANAAIGNFAHVDLERGRGYMVHIKDRSRFEAWEDSQDACFCHELPQTPEQRANYLLNDLLMRSDWITLDDLSGVLCVSRSALSNDVKCVERTLDRFGLCLEKRPHYGIRIAGPEMARRVCLANVIMDGYSNGGALYAEAIAEMGFAQVGDAPQNRELITTVSMCVERVIEEEHFQVNSLAYQNLLVHIAISLIRIHEGHYVPMPDSHLKELRSTREFDVARKIAAALVEKTGAQLPDEEIAYIGIHLAGKQTLGFVPGDADGDQKLVISDEVWTVVAQMLDLVWDVYRFDFRNDLELRMNLARHIVPLSVRLKYSMSVKNPMLSDTKVRYPLAYAMATDASTALASRYDSKLTDDEIGYIALAFALALERQKTEAAKKNVLMVCASGAGSARLLEYRVRCEFGDYIDTVSVCNLMDIDRIDFSKIDYVFTTVPISRDLPVPIREVKYFLDDAEIEDVKRFLSVGTQSQDSLKHFFDRKLFFPHLEYSSKQEVLDYLLDRAAQSKMVAANFKELVWKREGVVATAFGNNVAIPHPLEPASSETFVCVGLLDAPVVWDEYGRTVQVVFLSSFSADVGTARQMLYSKLADVLVSKPAMKSLISDQRWETLVGVLETYAGATQGRPEGG